MSDYTHYKGMDEITYLFPSDNVATVEVWIRWVISSDTLLDMWSLIHAVIKVKPC